MTGSTTTAAADGSFTLTATGTSMMVQASADGYAANRHQILLPVPEATQSWVLHQVSLEQNVVISPNTPWSVAFYSAAGGGVRYNIPSNALVDANGVVAQGNVHVALTYWDPTLDQDTGPGDLLTTRVPSSEQNRMRSNFRALNTVANASQLESYGESELVASQNGSALQVAQGINVVATYSIDNMAQFNASCAPNLADCGLWTLVSNSNTTWELLYAMNDPNVTVDLNAGTFTVNLPTLAPFLNIDVEKGNAACTASPPHMLGSACGTTLDCCQANGALICADSLCVPN